MFKKIPALSRIFCRCRHGTRQRSGARVSPTSVGPRGHQSLSRQEPQGQQREQPASGHSAILPSPSSLAPFGERGRLKHKGLAPSSLTPRFKAGVPACAEAALNRRPSAGGAWAYEESERVQRSASLQAIKSAAIVFGPSVMASPPPAQQCRTPGRRRWRCR
jgi:hypothetical protein